MHREQFFHFFDIVQSREDNRALAEAESHSDWIFLKEIIALQNELRSDGCPHGHKDIASFFAGELSQTGSKRKFKESDLDRKLNPPKVSELLQIWSMTTHKDTIVAATGRSKFVSLIEKALDNFGNECMFSEYPKLYQHYKLLSSEPQTRRWLFFAQSSTCARG